MKELFSLTPAQRAAKLLGLLESGESENAGIARRLLGVVVLSADADIIGEMKAAVVNILSNKAMTGSDT